MAIISFDKEALIDYVPEYADNRDSLDPCVVRLRYVPYSKVQHYARILAARNKGVQDPARCAEITQHIQKRQFTESVESVLGYFVEDREIADPEVFYETADTELVIEIIRAMESISRLSEGQRKN